MRIGARERLRALLDPEPISEIGGSVMPDDPLKFKDSRRYRDRLAQAQKTTRENDALVALAGQLHGEPVVACAFEFQFLGGSMGSVVGERFRRSVGSAKSGLPRVHANTTAVFAAFAAAIAAS